MQNCEHAAPPEFPGATAGAAFPQFSSQRISCGQLTGNARVSDRVVAEYLHEDIAQTVCAVKVHLEALAQTELRGATLDTSIAALQGVILQLSTLAADIRPAPVSRGAGARARASGAAALRRTRDRKTASENEYRSANLAVDFASVLGA